MGISSDGSVTSSGGLGMCQPAQDQFHWIEWSHYLGEGEGCHHPAQDHISSFFSLSALLLFSYPDYGSVLFCPVKTILDYFIIFLGSPYITHANFVKKCNQFCPK